METLTLEEFNGVIDRFRSAANTPAAESVDPAQICALIQQHGNDIQHIIGVLKAAAIFFPAAGKTAELIDMIWALAGKLCNQG